jgi:fructoselysine-6-P-deglycase FrlB-like protein
VALAYVNAEIASQPVVWRQAAALAAPAARALPKAGERVAAVGCGTSWFIAMAYAALREHAGQGETDAYPASEFPRRRYDRVVAVTRSGTTTEVLRLLGDLGVDTPTTVITGDPGSPAVGLATDTVLMPFADERSVVQTRFATSALALLRAHLGEDLTAAIADAASAVQATLPLDPARTEQVTFLGRGWTVGLAYEAALKCREAAAYCSEAYPAMDYRHGPISIARAGRAVWAFGEIPAGLADDVAATGAAFVHSRYNGEGHPPLDPMADLILAQRFAVAAAAHRGLDPDSPRHLSRSVVLP